jgi:polyphosphate kinase 2 (PPK2 family)
MNDEDFKSALKKLQLKMLRIQQGIWHKKERVIILFEGMDASGKGGAIRRATEILDPRGVRVHPIGAPSDEEQAKHWLYRFWLKLPSPGIITIFDRSWYGRVLVERVEELTEKSHWKRAYTEINQFEQMLLNDGVKVIKIFLDISKEEQLKRFESRLKDPYKQWKITNEDIRAREKWADYQVAIKEMIKKTSDLPWHVVKANDKNQTRLDVLEILTKELAPFQKWMEKKVKLDTSQRKLIERGLT